LQSFVARIFARLELDWQNYVVRDESLLRANDIAISVGDPGSAEKLLGWQARVRMPDVADRLADDALARA
jgi:GDPmannose 4,6-dehydratase